MKINWTLLLRWPAIIAGLILMLMVVPGCNKEEHSCGESLTIEGPSTVNEGENLVLTVDGLKNTGIKNFLWECPDMKPYNMLVEGRVPENDAQFVIADFNVQDIGEYSVKMYPDGENCAPIILEKTIEMNPSTCPCSEPAAENTLYYTSSYEGQFAEEFMSPIVYNSNTSEPSTITFNATNTLTVYFGQKIPEVSSTYNIAGGTYIYWDDNYDEFLDVHIHLDGWNHGIEYFHIEDMTEKMYVTRDGDILTIQFCDLQVHNYVTPQFTLSGKFVILL